MDMPCCSKSLFEKFDKSMSEKTIAIPLNGGVSGCTVKSLDKSKYKSLKYRLQNDTQKSDPTNIIFKTSEYHNNSSENTDQIEKSSIHCKPVLQPKSQSFDCSDAIILEKEYDKNGISQENQSSTPRLDDAIERIRALRSRKISEKDDILSILKFGNDMFRQENSLNEHIGLNSPSSSDSMRTKKNSRMNVSPTLGPTKIALPNGKIVKPKTLAEKRRLLRREFESEMRSKMQINDQLLERQILRQKSNNKRTESSDVRERLLYDNAPMTRLSWNRATDLQSSNTTFRQQFMMIDGRYVRICGSRGGSKRFLTPPPSSDQILEKSTKTIKRTDSDQQSQFLPGPLSRKHLLIREMNFGDGLHTRKKLPRVYLEVFPKCNSPLDTVAQTYLKSAFSETIDVRRAMFAATALNEYRNKDKYLFPLQYRNGQKEVLCRLKETDGLLSSQNASEKQELASDDKKIITNMLSGMFDYVETSFLGDAILQVDPDAAALSKSPEKLLTSQPQPEPTAISHVRKTALELRRLNVTVIEAKECASNNTVCCEEDYCRLGCICSSLKCLASGIKRHCGNVECMFECKCEYTHRLRQKRVLSNNAIDEDDMLELKDRVCSGLAPVEAEFKHAVVVNQDHSVTLVDGDTEKRKRSVKVPKRFDDYISSDLTVFPSQSLSPTKNSEEIPEPRKIIRTPIIPKEKLLLPRNLEVRLYNLGLKDVEPWCMVHELYRCFCDCKDAFGEPFAERKRDISPDVTDQTEDSKKSELSIKTLNRTILLETDDKSTARKKNWHVECFSSDIGNEESSDVTEYVRRKPGPASSKYRYAASSKHRDTSGIVSSKYKETHSPIPSKCKDAKSSKYVDSSYRSKCRNSSSSASAKHSDISDEDLSVRRRSNDCVKRKRSSIEEDKSDNIVTKQPRLQIKSPWDLNQMADKISSDKKDGDTGSLLREFTLSTTSVLGKNFVAKDVSKTSKNDMSYIETTIRQQRDNMKKSMRCARIDQPYSSKRDRKELSEKETQKRFNEICEKNANPESLRRLQILVKRSQIVSNNSFSGNTMDNSNNADDDAVPIKITPVKHALPLPLGPPPLKPAPGIVSSKQIETKVVDMISSPLPQKDQKAMSSMVNKEIIRMLNQKGALDAYFDISKPWLYEFQCLQWYKMLCKYKNSQIKLWLETKPEQNGTMALLTTGVKPPISNCIDMKTLEPAIAKKNIANVPKFALKIYADCQKLMDCKHKLQYVFMRAFPTHWTLEGVIEKGYKSKKETKPSVKEVTIVKGKSNEFANNVQPKDGTSQHCKNNVNKSNMLLNSELLKSRTEIEATLVDANVVKDSEKRKLSAISNGKSVSVTKYISKENQQKEILAKRRRLSDSKDVDCDKVRTGLNKNENSNLTVGVTVSTLNNDLNGVANKNPNLDSANFSNWSSSLSDNFSKLEPLPFLSGMRYLFVSMKENFNLLTSTRKGYRVTYLQLINAIQTANQQNVYVRLKFKQNNLNSDERGVVLAVPWCKDGVFIGPYGLSEDCLITKQIYWRNKILGLSEYTRTVLKRKPRPVGYWMCFYGDDIKFLRAYQSLVLRLESDDNKEIVSSSIITNPNNTSLAQIKGTSPNSLLKTTLNKTQSSTNVMHPSPQPDTSKMISIPKLLPKPQGESAAINNTQSVRDKRPLSRLQSDFSPNNNRIGFIRRQSHTQEKNRNGHRDALISRSVNLNRLSITDEASSNTKQRTVLQKAVPQISNNKIMLKNSPKVNSANTTILNANSTSSRSLLRKENTDIGTTSTTDDISKGDTSDDEPELIINEAENVVIDLLSDSEEELHDMGAPGKRWLYCDVNGIGYVEAQVLQNHKISVSLPLSSTGTEFANLEDATSFINTYVL